ncbi:MAG: DMT family transporter [Myxococcota bacterium]
MPSREQPLQPVVLAAILTQITISAGTHLAAKQATAVIPPVLLATLRLVLSAGVFVLVLMALPSARLPPRKTWGRLALFGLLSGPANQGLFLYGLARSRATHGGLLYALTPIGVYLLGLALGRERVSPSRFVGIAVAFIGVVVLLLGRGLQDALGPLVGDLFILGAVAAWVVWTTESRDFSAEYGGLRTAAWTMIVGGVWMLPLTPFVVTREALAAITPLGWACLAYLVLLTSVVSYALWSFALARVSASRVAVFSNLQPLATALAAWAVLGEPMGWEVAAGGLLVVGGVRLAQR